MKEKIGYLFEHISFAQAVPENINLMVILKK